MAQQTINVGTAPNDGTGTPLRTAFQYTNSNFSELYTAVGPSGNNIVVPGNATITGDLTVDTSTLKVLSSPNQVGIGTASPAAGSKLHVDGMIYGTNTVGAGLILFRTTDPTTQAASPYIKTPVTSGYSADAVYGFWYQNCGISNPAFESVAITTNASERYRIDSSGIATWSNVGGVAGTAMTLNSTGLGLGVSPITALSFPIGTNKVVGQSATSSHAAGNVGSLKFGIADGGGDYSGIQIFNTHNGTYSSQDIRFFTGEGGVSVCTERMRITPSGNVGIGVTSPSNRLEAQEAGTGSGLGGIVSSTATVGGNAGYVFRTGGTNRWSLSLTGSAGAESIRFYDVNNAATRMIITDTGNVISNVTGTAPTLAINSQMVFNLTSNTNLRISVRGTDGVTRTANITLA